MKKVKAFTIAEILIVLGTIGIIAQMTLPELIKDTQKIFYVTQLKKAYSNLNSAFKLYMLDQGTNDFEATDLFTSRNFNELNKYFKIIKTCTNAGDTACSIAEKHLTGTDAGNIFVPSGLLDSIVFYTVDGMCIHLTLQDQCNTDMTKSSKVKGICAYMHVDTNGIKGPNTYGRDLFYLGVAHDGSIFAFSSMDYGKYYTPNGLDWRTSVYYWDNGGTLWQCGVSGSPDLTWVSGSGCAARIIEENWEMNY